MPCHYCGKEYWVRTLVDKDFCCPSHRKKFHEQLRRNPAAAPAGPCDAMPPVHSGPRATWCPAAAAAYEVPPVHFVAVERLPLPVWTGAESADALAATARNRAALPLAGLFRQDMPIQDGGPAPWLCPPIGAEPAAALLPPFTLRPTPREMKRAVMMKSGSRPSAVWMRAVIARASRLGSAAALILVFLGLGAFLGQTAGPGATNSLRRILLRRAAHAWNDDFQAGLKLWHGAALWDGRREGYIRPERLAIFTPSRQLSDYRLEFLTLIETRAVAWAFRARDDSNYQAAQLRIVKAGPRPLLALVRYSVIGGVKEHAVEVPLRVMVHHATAFQVALEASGDLFSVSLDGERLDQWTDNRLPSGGVGFFNEPGATARIYWMQLSSHNDLLGKLCAFLTAGRDPVTAQIQFMGRRTNGEMDFQRVRARAYPR